MSIKEKLLETANLYPKELIQGEVKNINRIEFNIQLALNGSENKNLSDLEICDLGGGIGLFTPGCASLGFKRVVLIDDFGDPGNYPYGNKELAVHEKLGIEVFSRNVISSGISDIKGAFDVITSFDSMEHWHNSPKHLFKEVFMKLKSGGVFVLGVPNCVNLRKRITVPFGNGKWSKMEHWYEPDIFRGHVREPDVSDLLYIAKDMGLNNLRIIGRNWQGYYSGSHMIRVLTYFADHVLRAKPSLCSDIYLVGQKE